MQRSDFVKALAVLLAASAGALAQPPEPDAPPAASVASPVDMPDRPGMPPGPPGGMPPPRTSADMHYDVAVDVLDGRARLGADAARFVSGGRLAAGTTSGIAIRADRPHLNGLYVHGHAPFALARSRIDLAGAGVSDFDGIAAGTLVRDDATMVLRDVHVATHGIVSSAAVAMDKGTLKVYHSTLEAFGGPTPSGYVRRIGPGMMEPPTPLGIVGTARATLTMGEARSYFYDSTIVADGWGALSTDAARGAYVEANHCDIRVLRSGYGTYADNGATVVINDSTMETASFAGIVAGQASLSFKGTKVTSGGSAVMIHSVMGSPRDLATLSIKGGRFETTNAAILVKSANADITIDGARIASRNGDLLLVENNDDANVTKVGGQRVAGVHTVIRHTALVGNLLDIDTERGLDVRFESARLRGVIRGATVAFDDASRWFASADSQVTLAGAAAAAHLDAPAGVTIHALAGASDAPKGTTTLASGGTLIVE